MSFVNGCCYLRDHIATLSREAKPEEFWTTDDFEIESLRIACTIYCSNGTEREETRLKNRRGRLRELLELLNHTDLSKYWTDIPGALIWCLAVGANESWGCSEYSWFMARLMPMLMMLAMECWKDLKMTLSIFSWLLKCGRNSRVLVRL